MGREKKASDLCGGWCVCVCAQSPGGVRADPDRAQGALRSAAGAEDPRVRRTEPMCVWHSLGVINVLVRPPSLQSRPTPPPPRRAAAAAADRAGNQQEEINTF